MKTATQPLLLNSAGTAYAEWEGFGQDTGFPDNKELPSFVPLQQLALRRFRPGDLVLVAGAPGRSTARLMLNAGVHVLCIASNEDEANSWDSLTLLSGLDYIPVAGRFSGAVCFGRLSHLHNPRQVLEELHRILSSDGILLFDVLTREDQAYGLGQPLDVDSFVLKNTVFAFFSIARVESLLNGLFTIIETYTNSGDSHNCATYVVRKLGGTK